MSSFYGNILKWVKNQREESTMANRYKQVLVKLGISLRQALKQMDKAALQILIVVDDKGKLLGIVTDGDVRRAIINEVGFGEPIEKIMSKNPITMFPPADKDKALRLMKHHVIKHIPVVDKENRVIELILWEDFIENGEVAYSSKDTSVVIMAGGEGTRLEPFTRILPKPLIPMGEEPIIELVMDKFRKYGFSKFMISLGYKAEMLRMYFSENPNDYSIEYIQEKDFLGTAGSLALAKDQLQNTFIVSNCDIIIDTNFEDLLNYHKKNENKATILGVVRHIKIPYGILNLKNADLLEIVEKPEYDFIVNSGIYILEPELIDLIPRNQPMDMPDLLSLAKKKNLKIHVHPVSCSWFDVGQWEEYKKATEYMSKYG